MRNPLQSFVAVFLFISSAIAANAQSQPAELRLDPELEYRAERSDPVTYEVDFSVVVTPPYKTKKLSVWLPLPPNDFGQEVSEKSLTSFPMSVEPSIGTEQVYGNRFAYFEFDSPQGAQIIRHRFQIKVWELRWNVDPSQVADVENWPDSFDKYRRGDSQAIVVDERFEQLLREILPQKSAPGEDLTSVMKWVQENFTYDHHQASLQAKAEHGLTLRRGHCSDYHSFCAAMGRVIGVPTRVTYGINPFPKNSPSHCKLEVFLGQHGWVSFDVSETQKLVAEIGKSSELDEAEKAELIARAESRFVRGFRDNTWFLQTRGADYDLVPKASRRVPVVRTAYIEADGVPLPEPDPGDKEQQSFSWMTVHEYKPDRVVPYPFSDWKTLQQIEEQHER